MWQWVSAWRTCCKHSYKQENTATGNCLRYAKIFPLASVTEVSSSMKLRFTKKQTKKSYSNDTCDQPPTQCTGKAKAHTKYLIQFPNQHVETNVWISWNLYLTIGITKNIISLISIFILVIRLVHTLLPPSATSSQLFWTRWPSVFCSFLFCTPPYKCLLPFPESAAWSLHEPLEISDIMPCSIRFDYLFH